MGRVEREIYRKIFGGGYCTGSSLILENSLGTGFVNNQNLTNHVDGTMTIQNTGVIGLGNFKAMTNDRTITNASGSSTYVAKGGSTFAGNPIA